jgi:hypothetical protein
MNKEAIPPDLRSMFWDSAVDYANQIEPVTFETDEEMVAKQTEWNKVKTAYDQGVDDVLNFMMDNYDIQELSISVKLEKLREKHVYVTPISDDDQNFLNKMRAKIEDAYKFVNDTLCNEMPINTQTTRKWVIEKLEAKLEHEVVVKCDEENNPPDVINQCLLVAKVMWNSDYLNTWGYKYVTMIFGQPEAVAVYQNQELLDNETLKFIQKGI